MYNLNHKIKLEALIGIFIGVIIIYIAMAYTLDTLKEFEFVSKYSGTIESIFSSLAFAGLLYTIYQQQITIQTQVVEMRETRQQAIAANEIFKRQTDLLELQELSTGFFRHYDESYRLLKSIEGRVNSTVVHYGNEYFREIVNSFYRKFNNHVSARPRNERLKNNMNRIEEFQLDELEAEFNEYIRDKSMHSIILPYLRSIVLNVEYHLSKKKNSFYEYTYYNTLLRFSIEPETAKLICFLYLWSDQVKYPDFNDVIDELTLYAHFNFSTDEIDKIIGRKLRAEINANKPNEIDV